MRVKRDGAWLEVVAGDLRVGDRLSGPADGFEYEVTSIGYVDGVPDARMRVVPIRDAVGGYQPIRPFDKAD